MCQKFNVDGYNILSNRSFHLNCNTYNCPECSKRKQKYLFKAVLLELQTWHWHNMVTLSVDTGLFPDYESQYMCLQYAFQSAIYECRRNKHVNDKTFKYIRVNELFQSGYAHIHMLYNEFLPFTPFKYYFNKAAIEFCELNNLSYKFVNITSIKYSIYSGKKGAASYVTKYVMKSFQTINENRAYKKVYSKSRSIIFFNKHKTHNYCPTFPLDKFNSQSEWLIILQNERYFRRSFGLLIFRTSPHVFSWFSMLYVAYFCKLRANYNLPPENVSQCPTYYRDGSYLCD